MQSEKLCLLYCSSLLKSCSFFQIILLFSTLEQISVFLSWISTWLTDVLKRLKSVLSILQNSLIHNNLNDKYELQVILRAFFLSEVRAKNWVYTPFLSFMTGISSLAGNGKGHQNFGIPWSHHPKPSSFSLHCHWQTLNLGENSVSIDWKKILVPCGSLLTINNIN